MKNNNVVLSQVTLPIVVNNANRAPDIGIYFAPGPYFPAAAWFAGIGWVKWPVAPVNIA